MLLAPAPAREDTPAAWPLAAELASQVDRGRLMDDVNWLADDAQRGRQAGTADEDRVRDWLAQRVQALDLAPFAAIGLVGYTLPFTLPPEIHSGEPAIADNVIGLIPGAVYPDRYVTLSAHYDHLGTTADGQVFNGADDDATGVAAVLEAARILSGAATAPEETLVFVTFSAEEMGMLGADALCGRLEAAGLTASSQVLNLEVLGAIDGMGTYLDVWDEDDPRAEPLVQAVQTAGRLLGTRVDRQGLDPGSDARRLVGCGVQAISISVAWSLETHPCIHQPCDDPHLIDVDGFEAAVRVAVAAAWLLANDGR
jgi:putative aminopeptidase FrvX